MAPRTIAGRYVVERAVGHGGMGSVWLCRDEVLGRSVAVKEVGSMPGESTSDLARALREARNSAALNHPNVVSIYDAVEDGDHNWLVMEYVPSRTLSELVAQEGPLSPTRVAWIGAQAADGLSAAHERGTMHRDVKPGNILVTDDDGVKITDFGIARTHGDAQLTRSGIVTGTPAYFAPELAKGSEPTEAADVWALGASLYAAVEGRLPYPGQTNAIALLAQIAAAPPSPPERAAFMAEPIARMMDHDPRTRWTMSDVSHALHRLHDQHAGPSPRTVSFATPLATPLAAAASPQADPTPEPDDGPATEATDVDVPKTDTQTDPGTEPAPAAVPQPPRGEDRPVEAHGRRRLAVAALVLLVALASIGAFLLGSRDGDDRAAEPGETSAPGSAEPGDDAQEDSQGEGSAAPPEQSATDPGQFVESYYALLPADTETAWALLSPALQGDVGGYGTYTGFWRTISAVRVDDTRVVEDGVVEVDLTYTSDRGTESETRLLRVEDGGEGFLVVGDRTA